LSDWVRLLFALSWGLGMATVVVSADVEVFYSDRGRGPSLLMLHGWTCDGADWSWLAGDLAFDHRVVVPDLRGHGRSTRTVGGYGARILADDMVELLGHLGIEHAVVVGHSMGAIVASVMAVEHPDMVSALVLVDPKYGLPDARAESLSAAMKLDPLKTARGIFEGFYTAESPLWQRVWHDRRLHGMPDSVTAAVFFAMFGSGTLGRRSVAAAYLVRRKCPILAIYSGLAVEAAEWERSLGHGLQDQIHVWTGAGHFLHQERPEEFARLVRDWLCQFHSSDA
jgi:pimeloyl-ACP methyl ester carboxylesterase